ncbi:hypothetical protein [Prosthecobacter sp.]|uniref:hypothetical protein n=1 Tax=Prosthecobacter sp. TaxID=1965333 RepID=UPI002489824A|nr:hypothetical protein [Prosthecobacter sp.]MDI1315189.1 hypothetical protein [Prosthecobacter sp.]
MRKISGFFSFWGQSLRHTFSIGGAILAVSGGFLAIFVTLTFKYFPALGSAEWIAWFKEYQIEVIFVAGIIGGLLHGPYVVYGELETKARGKIEAANKEAANARQEAQVSRRYLLEQQENTNSANLEQVKQVAAKYTAVFQVSGNPACPFWRMKIMLESGLLSLAEIPDSPRHFQQTVMNLGWANPFEGVTALKEEKEWVLDRIWTFLPWAVQKQIFASDEAADAPFLYLEAILPSLAAGNAPDMPLVAKPSSLEVVLSSSEPPETHASTPPQP